jgi:hypothetical protein
MNVAYWNAVFDRSRQAIKCTCGLAATSCERLITRQDMHHLQGQHIIATRPLVAEAS